MNRSKGTQKHSLLSKDIHKWPRKSRIPYTKTPRNPEHHTPKIFANSQENPEHHTPRPNFIPHSLELDNSLVGETLNDEDSGKNPTNIPAKNALMP